MPSSGRPGQRPKRPHLTSPPHVPLVVQWNLPKARIVKTDWRLCKLKSKARDHVKLRNDKEENPILGRATLTHAPRNMMTTPPEPCCLHALQDHHSNGQPRAKRHNNPVITANTITTPQSGNFHNIEPPSCICRSLPGRSSMSFPIGVARGCVWFPFAPLLPLATLAEEVITTRPAI